MSNLTSETRVFPTLREIVAEIDRTKKRPCCCDLDNWEPNRDTGHSRVCWIDKEAREKFGAVRMQARKVLNEYRG